MTGIDILSDNTGKEIVAAIQSTDVAQARILEINEAAESKKNEVLKSIPEDYRNIVDDVNELKSDLTDIRFKTKLAERIVCSWNLLNPDTMTDGYYIKTDGTIAEASNWWISEKIPVVAGKYYYIWGTCVFYTEDDSFISYHSVNDSGNVTIPSNASYLIACGLMEHKSLYYINYRMNHGYDNYKEVTAYYALTNGLVIAKDGSGDYTSLTKALWDNDQRGFKFIVKCGTYDLESEYKEYLGSDIFDSSKFDSSDNPITNTAYYEGLPINNSFVYLDSGANIVFDYDGIVAGVSNWFSPIKFSGLGGELHGGNIHCTNCRYAIHDDCYTSPSHSKRVTDGVNIYYRSSRNVAIGGGLGNSSDVTLKNCWVDSGTSGYGVFYHNASSATNPQNIVRIMNNYFTDSIVIQTLGPYTTKSKAIVSNNKAHSVDKTITSGSADNIDVMSFNNVVDTIHNAELNKYDRLVS